MKSIGITETYDPCFVSDWETRLLDANIIISKELSDEMIEKLLITQDRVIFHHTVTGQGGTVIEPNVKPTLTEFNQFKKLIERGFPISHYVLRIDPICPFSPAEMERVVNVLQTWENYLTENDLKIRCRVSVVDLFKHALERLQGKVNLSWTSFTAPDEIFDIVEQFLEMFKDTFDFECCAEQKFKADFISHFGCASYKDIEILQKDKNEYGEPEKKQRQECQCLAKKQILGVKPGRCAHQCLYCFWK